MTIIAYRDGIMAADTAVTQDHMIVAHRKKVHKTAHGVLVGCAGRTSYSQAVLEAVEAMPLNDVRTGEILTILAGAGDDGASALIVHPNGAVYTACQKTGRLILIEAPYYAIGAGAEVAIGAMAVGATAVQAAAAAVKHSHYCGGAVDSMPLDSLLAAAKEAEQARLDEAAKRKEKRDRDVSEAVARLRSLGVSVSLEANENAAPRNSTPSVADGYKEEARRDPR